MLVTLNTELAEVIPQVRARVGTDFLEEVGTDLPA
jgi:hypothetical protein